MATVFIDNSQNPLSVMSTRRVPLSSNPNAVNSPYRVIAAAAAAKQKRSYATIQREEAYGQPPPAKKQMLDVNCQDLKSPSRPRPAGEGRMSTRKSNIPQPTALTPSLEATKSKSTQQAQAKVDSKTTENLETVRQWQRHYRRVFPKFVFYFESIPEDYRVKFSKQVAALGAREENFFSNAVTHVVTTRPIPPEHDVSPADTAVKSPTNDGQAKGSHPQTINPLLLDRLSEHTAVQSESRSLRSKFTFEASIGRKVNSIIQDTENKRQQGRNVDVLYRAREMGIKIWAQEKLERMMITMFNTDTGSQVPYGHNVRNNLSHGVTAVPRTGREADLSQLLRDERINGPSDRDPTVATKEMVIFKGPFIYIHDIDEKQRPIMAREYAKVSEKEDGDWPQFRSVSNGKCPFVEDVEHNRSAHKEMVRHKKYLERQKSMASRTRAATAAAEAARMEPPRTFNDRRPSANTEGNVDGKPKHNTMKRPEPLSIITGNCQQHSTKGPQNAFVSRAGTGRLFGGEPVASGLQPSNVTSAIRSQMISSTAAVSGAKAGTSKEIHGLQRKVLEKNSGPASLGLTSSHRMTDIAAAAREDAAGRLTRSKVQENLAMIEEDATPIEVEDSRRVEATRKTKVGQRQRQERRDIKNGYCENCMGQFDDFDEHVTSHTHRKFAEKKENWRELDALLSQLARPLRGDY